MSTRSKTLRTVAFHRRFCLGGIVAFLVTLAAVPMAWALSREGWTILNAGFLALLIILVVQVVFSSAVALAGWWLLRHGADPSRITTPPEPDAFAATLPATAIVMPIFNEDAGRVFQGLKVMCQSLEKTGRADAFDIFILSDSTDPNCWIAEEKSWFELCKQTQGFGRIFYRRRLVHLHHKSGNIADFCRRWGASYRYMIVLDADSLMAGWTFVRLVASMEERPWVGIIQTMTLPVLGESLFQRIGQFSACVYRPLFAAGAGFWQLGDASYFGHNAIIRMRPFIRHCAMPELPEVGPLGRRILSHDTIEAALMRRGGYEVWQVSDLEGSYEEGPPHLLASLKRDRRWCHGNLQHVWFLFERGLKTVSRFNILMSVMAYANSPLWLLSLALGVLAATHPAGAARQDGRSSAAVSAILYAGVMVLLILPKILGATILTRSPEKLKLCGGRAKVAFGVAVETIYSMLLAPILMLFYTRFVVASFCGGKVEWGPQVRFDDKGPGWGDWISVHWVNTLLALAATTFVVWRIPSLLPWMIPVFAGPLLAIPLSRVTASRGLGLQAKAEGWFVTPEEAEPPAELANLAEPFVTSGGPFDGFPEDGSDHGLRRAVFDPYVNAIHFSLLRHGADTDRRAEQLGQIAGRLLKHGPSELTPEEKKLLLSDADAMLSVHQKLWSSPVCDLHESWRGAVRG